MYRCRICSEEWEAIPDHAVLLNKRGVNHVYRFSDNTVHILYRARPISADHRWHKTPRPDCLFCNPSAEPEKLPEPSSPVAEQLSQEVIQVLDKLPESEI